jgi:phospholipid/cholesterol/gamma-HCH transport system substrate-binding protein
VKKRRRHARISNPVAGLIAGVVILAACWLVFGGPTPWGGGGFKLKAVFTVQTQLHLESPVRVAGVDVGKVTAIKRVGGSSPAAVVTMTVDQQGLPIHSNATADIRPRLFLEGNFYVDIQPGTPSAPALSSGATLAAAHTSGPVQLDRVLSALNSNTRSNLQVVLKGLGAALADPPSAAADATASPSQKGLTAAQSLNRSLDYSAAAFRASSIVDEALLGETPHDLSGAVSGTSKVFSGLAASGDQLGDLVQSLDQVTGALASRQSDLSQTIADLPATLRAADAALGPLEASFGPTQAFARDILPGIQQLGSTVSDALPWLHQSQALLSKPDLGTLLTSLTPAVQGTASTLISTRSLLSGTTSLARCLNDTVIPTGNEKVLDPPVTTGLKDYQELLQAAVGLASDGQNFDGNGRYLRTTVGGGSDRVATGSLGSGGPLYGNAVLPPLGTRPAFDSTKPVIQRKVLCDTQKAPDLNSATSGTGP